MKSVLIFTLLVSPVLVAANTTATIEANAKLCLSSVYTVEKEYFKKHKRYAEDLSDLDMSSAKICDKFQVFVMEGTKEKFRVRIQAPETAWSVDETKNMTKLR